MTARDDFPTLAAAETLVCTRRPLGREISTVLDELDTLRTGRNLADRIEGLRARARAAEDLVHTLAGACRTEATKAHRSAARAAFEAWLTQERVA